MPKLMFKDRAEAMKPYGRITQEDYMNLNSLAKELNDYWMNWKPEMYNSMSRQQLLEILESEGDRLDEMVCDLIQSGMDVAGALEVARAEIYETET